MLIILTTTPNLEEAETLGRKIVEAKLAACVQILPQMKSIYFWKDGIQTDDEHLLLIKTLDEKYPELEQFIKANHSYETPEIVAIEVDKVSDEYSKWLEESLKAEK